MRHLSMPATLGPNREKRRASRLPKADRLPWTGYLAIVVLLAYVLVAFGAPILAIHSPTDVFVGAPFEPPSAELWLGTDALGRDVASRFLYGGRTVLATACGGAAVATILGGLIGIFLGLRGGIVDEILMRILEIMMSIPAIIFALLIVGLAGVEQPTIILTVGLLSVPNVARVVRAATLVFVDEDFIAAAKARGEGMVSISLRELLPNVLGTLVVEFSIRTGFAVLFIGGLGFLGFGVAPRRPIGA